jgi:hypothetical protein
MSEINLIGFDGPEAHSVIYWQIAGANQSKTICYSAQEERESLARLNTVGDFYNSYDTALIFKHDSPPVSYGRIQAKKGA